MISQRCSPWLDLVASDTAMHTARSDSNESKLKELYKSTKLSNKSTEVGLLDAKDKHRTSPSNAFIEELVDRADRNGIKNSAMSLEGGSNKSSHQACSISSSINSLISPSIYSPIHGPVYTSSTGPNCANCCANDKNEMKSDDKRSLDPGRRMTNEASDEIKNHHIMNILNTINSSPEFENRNAYKAGSLSDCLLTSTQSNGYSTPHPSSDCSSNDHRSTENRQDNRSTDSTDRPVATKSKNSLNPPTGLPGSNLFNDLSNHLSSLSADLNKPMDLLAKQPTINRKMQFSSFSLLLVIQLLICGPTSTAAGRHSLSIIFLSIILSPKWSSNRHVY